MFFSLLTLPIVIRRELVSSEKNKHYFLLFSFYNIEIFYLDFEKDLFNECVGKEARKKSFPRIHFSAFNYLEVFFSKAAKKNEKLAV